MFWDFFGNIQALPIVVGDQFKDETTGLYFEITSLGTPKTVKVIRDKSYYSNSSYNIPSSVTYSDVEYTVTEIGYDAFYNCKDVTSVTLPSTITTIGEYAFSSCSFSSIDLPAALTAIGQSAFWTCKNLQSIIVPANVTTIGYNAFDECTALASVTFLGNACQNAIGDNVFNKVGATAPALLTLPDNWGDNRPVNNHTSWYGGCFEYEVPAVGDQFEDATYGLKFEVTAVGEADTVKVIANSYTGTSYNIPATVSYNDVTFAVTEIGEDAFWKCDALQSVTIPASVTTIGSWAFAACSALTSVTFLGNACQEGIAATAFAPSLDQNPLILLTLPDNWGDNRPANNHTTWCGRLFEYEVPVLGDQFVDATYGLKFEITAIGEANTVKVVSNGYTGTSYTVPATVKHKEVDFAVTEIGAGAFQSRSSLQSVTIAASVTTIGANAFKNCSKLTSVTFLGNACQESIAANAFSNVGYTTPALLTLPANWTGSTPVDNKTAWYGGKFNYTAPAKTSVITYTAKEKLQETTDAGQTFALHLNAFYAADSTQLTVTHTFDEAEGVGTITLNGEVAIIGDNAFYGTSIASITIPEGVKMMGENTFYSCDSLKTISLPTSLTTFGGYVFHNCTALTSITIPANVTNTGNATFIDCSALASVTLPEGLTTIGDESFSGCSSLQSITIPESVTMIEEYAFFSCSSLQSITIPAGVTTIEDYVFCECTSLTSITIPSSVTKIGEAAFASTGLTSVTIPASVTELGAAAFGLCASLASVTFESNACQDAIGEMAFMSVGDPDPALLTLPNSWTGTLPDEDGKWYGGKFELSSIPTALPTLFGDGVKGNKLIQNGQLLIRKDGKNYNVLGGRVK